MRISSPKIAKAKLILMKLINFRLFIFIIKELILILKKIYQLFTRIYKECE